MRSRLNLGTCSVTITFWFMRLAKLPPLQLLVGDIILEKYHWNQNYSLISNPIIRFTVNEGI